VRPERESCPEGGDGHRWFDLLRFRPLKRMLAHRAFQPLAQLPFVLAFLFLIYVGLFEYPSAGGLPVILTWVIWWTGIVFLVAFFGKFWCTVCPWNAIADWINRLAFLGRTPDEDLLSAQRPWPGWLRNISMATVLFAVLVWLELLPGLDMVVNPRATAILALFILALTLFCVLRYGRSSFCRYGCLVGRISGLYSMMAPFELRARDREVCLDCRTKDCYLGNEKGYPCPTFEHPETMDRNTYCILCTECIKTCPHDNIAFNLRPFGTDLLRLTRTRPDEAYLALLAVSLTLFHIITMTPLWTHMERFLRAEWRMHRVAAYTSLMVVIMLLPVLLHAGAALLSRVLSREPGVRWREAFIHFAYPLLPVALFGHLAHNSEHMFEESGFLVPALTDPLNRGWDLLGLGEAYVVRPLLGAGPVEVVKLAMVAAGFLLGLVVVWRVGGNLYGGGGRLWAGLAPVFVWLVGLVAFQWWILGMPMVSRLGLG